LKHEQPKFNVVFCEAIQEGLNSISPSISDVVLFYLQKKAPIRFDQYIIDPEAFDDGLKGIFGYGAEVIEKKILECLYLKLKVSRKIKGDFKFTEEVKKAEKLLDSPDLPMAETTHETKDAHKSAHKVLMIDNKAQTF